MRCFVCRIQISHALDSDEPIPDRVERHLLRCPDCRGFHVASTSLSAKLRSDLQRDPSVLTDRFVSRVVAAADQSSARPPSRAPWIAVLASCLAILLLAWAVLGNRREEAEPPPVNRLATAAQAITDLGFRLLEWTPARDEAGPWTAPVADPLEAEARHLRADAVAVKDYFLSLLARQPAPISALTR